MLSLYWGRWRVAVGNTPEWHMAGRALLRIALISAALAAGFGRHFRQQRPRYTSSFVFGSVSANSRKLFSFFFFFLKFVCKWPSFVLKRWWVACTVSWLVQQRAAALRLLPLLFGFTFSNRHKPFQITKLGRGARVFLFFVFLKNLKVNKNCKIGPYPTQEGLNCKKI